jgi:hypothetical protein
VNEGKYLRFPWSSKEFVALTHNVLYEFDTGILQASTLEQLK